MLKSVTKWTVLCYGLLVIILGFIGYYERGSVVSFAMGGAMGVLLLLSAWLMFRKKEAGAYASLILTILLTGVFAYRYSMTGAPIPALMAVLSGATLIFLLLQMGHWRR